MTDLDVQAQGCLIVVQFYAVYDKPTDEPGLNLRGRAETKNHRWLRHPII